MGTADLQPDSLRRGSLIKGLLGFVGGAILYLCTSKDHDFKSAALMGLFLSGVPYGWELMGRILGDLVVVGHIAIMLIVFVIRFCLSVFIGWFTYPIALVYNLMKTQKVGSVSRLILTAILVIVVILIVSFIYLLAQPLSSIPSMFAT